MNTRFFTFTNWLLTAILCVLLVTIFSGANGDDLYTVHYKHHTCIVDHTGFTNSISCDWSKP